VRKNKGVLCIDIDLDEPIPLSKTLDFLRSLYEFSWIKREVRITEHGLHVYIEIPYPDDRIKAMYFRQRYGDDERRMEHDMFQSLVNVCFTSTERYRTEPFKADRLVFNNPEMWRDGQKVQES